MNSVQRAVDAMSSAAEAMTRSTTTAGGADPALALQDAAQALNSAADAVNTRPSAPPPPSMPVVGYIRPGTAMPGKVSRKKGSLCLS